MHTDIKLPRPRPCSTLDAQDIVSILAQYPVNRRSNYIIPGLQSTLLVERENQLIRLFEMTREQEYYVTPHNHRFAFKCLVLTGEVQNVLYVPQDCTESTFALTHARVTYSAATRSLDFSTRKDVAMRLSKDRYTASDWYEMRAEEYHSIIFAPGTKVLFIEEKDETPTSNVLLPLVNGKLCNTFMYDPSWMFLEETF